MRDPDGIFVGYNLCKHYGGFSSYAERTCCKDRVTKYAKSVCRLKGVVESELVCNGRCSEAEVERGG